MPQPDPNVMKPDLGFALEKKWAYLCYIPVFNIVSCLLASVRMVNSKFCRFHYRQGLVIFAVWVVTILVSWISRSLSLMLWGVVLFLYITGLMVVYRGKMAQIPVVGQLAMVIPEFYLYKLLTGKTPPDEAIGGDDNDKAL